MFDLLFSLHRNNSSEEKERRGQQLHRQKRSNSTPLSPSPLFFFRSDGVVQCVCVGGGGECMFAYVLEGGVGVKVSVIAILSASGCM